MSLSAKVHKGEHRNVVVAGLTFCILCVSVTTDAKPHTVKSPAIVATFCPNCGFQLPYVSYPQCHNCEHPL